MTNALDCEEIMVADEAYKPLPCPNAANHTKGPRDYVGWNEWAHNLSKTHQQKKCHGCGRFEIWEPKQAAATFEALQRELADEAATSDVDCCCLREEREGGMWYDLASVEEADKDWLARAVRYLDMRQMLERDAEGRWARIKP